jgi:hypothetical protein
MVAGHIGTQSVQQGVEADTWPSGVGCEGATRSTYNQPRKGDQYGTREGKRVVKTGIFAMVLLVNAVALFCIFNPWITDWQGQGIVVLVVEAAAVVVIGAPVFFYHFIREQKPLRQSLEDTVRIIMDFLTGWV